MKSILFTITLFTSSITFACPDFSGKYLCKNSEAFQITQIKCSQLEFKNLVQTPGNVMGRTWYITGKIELDSQPNYEGYSSTFFYKNSVVRVAESRYLVDGELTTYRWQYEKTKEGLVYSALEVRAGEVDKYESGSVTCQRL